MKPACINHPNKNTVAKGLCSACYMKQRRQQQSGYTSRRPNGHGYNTALQHAEDWIDRFVKKIKINPETDCHEWTAQRTGGGYGVFYFGGYTLLAHRLARAMAGGKLNAQVVMHTCDNPCCVNPEHLKDGTYRKNMADMDQKGRRNVGAAGEHLKDRQSHPRARAVVTPYGEFASASLAADSIPLSARVIQRYCRDEKNGYKYAQR